MNDTAKESRLGNRPQKSEDREARELQDRAATENREISDSDRLATFQNSFFQSALPDLPQMEGFHVCWLTTTNPRDPIVGRMRLGYELIRAQDVPGYETLAGDKSAPFPGVISVNEMVAARLPIHLYKMYMTEAHHTQPAEEERKLSSVLDTIREQAEGRKFKVDVEEGTAALGKAIPRPRFEGT